MPACKCTRVVQCLHRAEEGAIFPELELLSVVTEMAGNQTKLGFSETTANALKLWAISLALTCIPTNPLSPALHGPTRCGPTIRGPAPHGPAPPPQVLCRPVPCLSDSLGLRALPNEALPLRALPCVVLPLRALPCVVLPLRALSSEASGLCQARPFRSRPCQKTPCQGKSRPALRGWTLTALTTWPHRALCDPVRCHFLPSCSYYASLLFPIPPKPASPHKARLQTTNSFCWGPPDQGTCSLPRIHSGTSQSGNPWHCPTDLSHSNRWQNKIG